MPAHFQNVVPLYAAPYIGTKLYGCGEKAVDMEFENILSQLLKQDENRMNMRGEEMKENVQKEEHTHENAQEKMTEKMPDKMPEKQYTRGAEMGDLPCEAPIGMTYTPWQRKGSPRYTAGEALDRGTLWPGLELPWKNNFNVRSVANTPLGEVQALDFALVELALYLDTHPDDTEALRLFRQYVKAYQDKKAAYAKKYGPLEKTQAGEGDRWNWIDNPWPWEYTDRR